MKKGIFIVALIISFGLVFLVLKLYFPVQLPQINELKTKIEEIKKEIVAPPPLRASKDYETSFFTRAGIIKWTNVQRRNNGLAALSEDTKLNIVASLRAKDMFENQYFAHGSPTGKDAQHLVDGVSYEYIMIGENLALGNFKNDQEVVQAWMDSPGHRANILNSRFRDIGVAALKGTFEGHSTWIMVQVFGRPTSACPQPDSSLKNRIELNEMKIEELKLNLDRRKTEIENMKPQSGPEYNKKIEEYNSLVNNYNDLVTNTKNLVNEYNGQVQSSNQCITAAY